MNKRHSEIAKYARRESLFIGICIYGTIIVSLGIFAAWMLGLPVLSAK